MFGRIGEATLPRRLAPEIGVDLGLSSRMQLNETATITDCSHLAVDPRPCRWNPHDLDDLFTGAEPSGEGTLGGPAGLRYGIGIQPVVFAR
jgi:hypothetical protein